MNPFPSVSLPSQKMNTRSTKTQQNNAIPLYKLRTILKEEKEKIKRDLFHAGSTSVILNILKILEASVEKTSYLNSQLISHNNKTPLHLAVEYGNEEIVQLFLESGAIPSLHLQEKNGFTPLHRAVHFNIKYGNEEIDIESHDHNFTKIVEILLQSDKDSFFFPPKDKIPAYDMGDEMGWTPLHLAAQNDKNLNIVVKLIQSGANINAQNKDSMSAKDVALNNKSMKILSYLYIENSKRIPPIINLNDPLSNKKFEEKPPRIKFCFESKENIKSSNDLNFTRYEEE